MELVFKNIKTVRIILMIDDKIDENICGKIKPYIKGTNNIDYNHKCVKEDNKCITKQKECFEYDPSKETCDY